METKNRQIHVAMASDDNYAHHLAVAICSILRNLSADSRLCIYLLYEKLEDGTKVKLEQLKNIRAFDIQYINISCEKYASYKIEAGAYISKLTYARFQLPELLHHLDKCLYLDCDIIVRQDLGKLWDIQLLKNSLLGAVEEPGARHRNKELGIPEDYSYFNAGVLLLDLAGLRRVKLEDMAFDFLQRSGSLLYADQDVLNALFYDSWYTLPLKWNVHTNVYLLQVVNKYYRYSHSDIVEGFENAALVHFSHERKPDSLISESPYRKEYWQYLKYTAWNGMWPKDISLANISLRIYWVVKDWTKKFPAIFHMLRAVKRLFAGYYLNKSHSR